MKPVPHHFITNSTLKGRIFSSLVLATILSLGTTFTTINSALASPENISQFTSKTVNDRDFLISQTQSNRSTNNLPNQVANAVRKDLSNRTRIALGKLQVITFSKQTWPDGCLGIAEPNQFCTQATVPGWRIVVSDGKTNWVYHTDNTGRNIRLEKQNLSFNSTKSSQNRVNYPLAYSLVREGGLSLSSRGFNRRVLSEISNPDSESLQLVSNETLIAAILKPLPIPSSKLPPALDRGVLFQAISSGGFAGLTYQTTLMNDGLLMRVRIGDANDSERSVRKIPTQQFRQFQSLLKRQPLSQYNRLSYPAPSGSADYITVTLISSSGTVRYADIVQNQLPKSLREVIQAWNKIISTPQS